MNGIVVSVNYGDLLGITLPRNAHHFEKILVVSAHGDEETARVVAAVPNAELFVTDAFYRRGARFNKGLAMEEGFDVLGRDGWIAIWDGDIVLPQEVPWQNYPLQVGWLYSSHRRILADPTHFSDSLDWQKLPRRREVEMAGYLQIFHARDPRCVNLRPWYGIDWTHAGGCDSDFQKIWPLMNQHRLDFDVLHIGEPDVNWFGRATKRADGTVPEGGDTKRRILRQMFDKRHHNRRNRTYRYEGEKVAGIPEPAPAPAETATAPEPPAAQPSRRERRRRRKPQPEQTSELITAVMPTSGSPERRVLSRLAIESFRRQTHRNKRLLILNHGDTPLALPDEDIQEVMVSRPGTLGELRNLAFDYLPPGSWAITWDDDDWHDQYRMHRQLSHALKVKQRAVILANYLTVDLATGQGFVRQGRKFKAGGCCGTILWQVGRERYPARDAHEDSDFAVAFKERKQLGVIANPPTLYIRTYHGGNTSDTASILSRRQSRELHREEAEQLEEVLKEFKKLGVI